MRAAAALLAISLAAMLAGDLAVPPAHAQSQDVQLAQNNNNRSGGFLRFLFGNRRQNDRQPPADTHPFQLFGNPQPQQQAPVRRSAPSPSPAPTPHEVAAVQKADDAKRALVVGDFMARSLAKGLADAYADNPNIVIVDATSGSSGLVRDDYFDWPAKIAAIVDEQKPDVILVMIGANDRQALSTDAGSQSVGSDGWRAAYAARVAAFADALKATGKPTLWGGLVPVQSSTMSRDYSSFNGIVKEQLDAKGIRFIDMWNGFADEEGKFVAVGPDVSGQSVQLRASDGLNFTRAGQGKLAFFVEQELNDVLGGAAPFIASGGATSGTVRAGPAAPEIGPMVSLDALSVAGGDTLSGGLAGEAPDSVSMKISEELAGADAAAPPAGRADSYLWPLPDSTPEEPSAPSSAPAGAQ